MTTVTSTPGQIRRAWLAWIAVCLIWGTTYLAVKICLQTMGPFLQGGLRNIAAGLILAIGLIARGHALPPRTAWGRLAILGFFMFLFGNGGVVWGVEHLPSGLAAVLVGTSPFWMVGVEALVAGGRTFHLRQFIGLLVGFAGIVILVWPDIAQGGAGGRQFLLGVIEEKTKGNLSIDEQRLIENSVTELRFRYVQSFEAHKPKAEGQAQS